MDAKKKLILAVTLSVFFGFIFGFFARGFFEKRQMQQETTNIPIHQLKSSWRNLLTSNELIAPGIWGVYLDPLWTPVNQPLTWMKLPKFGSLPFETPTIKTVQTDREIRLEAKVPGLTEKDINVQVGKDEVAITGRKTVEKKLASGGAQTVQETFEQVVQLPASVDGKNAKATLKDGTLTVLIPKEKSQVAESKNGNWQ